MEFIFHKNKKQIYNKNLFLTTDVTCLTKQNTGFVNLYFRLKVFSPEYGEPQLLKLEAGQYSTRYLAV
jgi:hypothetical protein